MSKSILTLTLNPALDRIVTVDRLVFEDRGYIQDTTEAAGGRGINASRVLTSFGRANTAITTSSGKEIGRKFEEQLAKDSFEKEIVRIRSSIRTNLTISDQQGLSVKLNEKGPALVKMEVQRLEKAVERLLPQSSWLMLCGSVPPGVDERVYANLIRLAEEHGVQTMLDADGDALLFALEAKPTLVKPNQSEAERLLNKALITRSQLLEAVLRIKQMGPHSVVLSLGSRGAMAVDQEGTIVEVMPPPIEAVCPIGAGDAMSAAIVWALDQQQPFAEAIRWGVAAGTASTRLPGITLANLDQARVIYPLTQVNRVAL